MKTISFIVNTFFFILFISNLSVQAQELNDFEEISISLIVQELGTVEIPALINENEEVYLPIKDVFDYLKIKNSISVRLDTLSGFFINPEAVFLIDNVSKNIHYQDNVFNLKPDDLIRSVNNLYLKTDFFGEVFGLVCDFNFRKLSVNLNTMIELPAIRDLRLQKMRDNIKRLAGEMKADTVIERDFKLFNFGMADWAINNINFLATKNRNTGINLSLGGIVAGGETRATLNYSSGQTLSEKHLSYLWRYANNKNQLLRQVKVGHIYSDRTSTIYSPIIGVQLTNSPTSFRRSFGFYTLSDFTEPGWIVELYVNNVLVDYIKADDSGFFTFEVPLLYGNTDINLRFYGPWGEERSSSQNFTIPYNFLPPNELEFTTTAGVLRDSKNNLFSRTNINYGVSRYLTVGSGLEYLSSLQSQSLIPLLNSSLSLTPNLLFFGEYAAGVKSNAILSYRMQSGLQFELNYTKYDKDQKAINTNRLEERKLSISMPIKLRSFSLYSRFNINQAVLPNNKYTIANLLFSGFILGVSVNLTTNAQFFDYLDPQAFSNLSISFRLPKKFVIRPQVQYDYNIDKISIIKCSLEKQFFDKLNFHALIEKNFTYDYFNIQAGFRYELPFAQAGSSVSYANGSTTLYQSASGSLIYDAGTNYFTGNNRTSEGRGGIVILPYLDINANNHHDESEPRVNGLEVKINGGRVEFSESDTTIRILDLEPYRDYFIELTNSGFKYIAWLVKKPTINISINPNQFTLIEVPIAVLGEVSGTVYLDDSKGKYAQDRILVNIYDNKSNLVSSVMSEYDGYFNYLGLKPGSYTARIDSNQLNNLKMTSIPFEQSFEILPTFDGDFIYGLDFVLNRTQKEYIASEQGFEEKNIFDGKFIDNRDDQKIFPKTMPSETEESDSGYEEGAILVLQGSASFQFGKSELLPNPKTGLDRLSEFMKENPETNWVIEGHTDSRGSEELNYNLSLERAKAVLNYFEKKGLDLKRFEIIGYGESKPMADNSIEFGRALNRRVVIREKKSYEEMSRKMTTISNVNYNFINEYNIESKIFTDNQYYCILVSSWNNKSAAIKEVERLRAKGHSAFYSSIQHLSDNKKIFTVRIGYFTNLEGTREYLKIIR